MPTPLVSVLIPTYRSAAFIGPTVDAVRAQTYPEIEIVIVDDGSPDDTVRVCRALGPGITLIEQENQGRGAARQRAFEASRGELLAFLDADDLLEPDSIERRVRYLEAHPDTGFVFTDAMEFDDTGDRQLFLDQFPWLDPGGDQFQQLLWGVFPLTSTVMVHRRLMERVGGFKTHLPYGEDAELFLQLLLITRAGHIDAPLTRRRMHDQQGSRSTRDRWASRVRIFSKFRPAAGVLTARQTRQLQTALRHAHFKLAEWYWETWDMAEARRHFSASLGPHSWTPGAAAYWVASHLPARILRGIRGVRHGAGRA